MLFGAHEHHNPVSSLVLRDTSGTRTHQRAPAPQSRKPCRQKHGLLSLSRVQGGNACSESRGEAFGPRHFAGFRRKTESVMVGNYTFAESAAPPLSRGPNVSPRSLGRQRRPESYSRRSPGREAYRPDAQTTSLLIPEVSKGAAAPWHTDLARKV